MRKLVYFTTLLLSFVALGFLWFMINYYKTDEPDVAVSITATPTNTPTATPTSTPKPTNTVTPSPTNTPTSTPTPTPTEMITFTYPTDEEIQYMAKVIHGEAGICDDLQKSAVAWCVLNRVDWFEYPDTVKDVITQPHQFKGYSDDEKPTESDYAIAVDVLFRWLNNLDGRTLPKNYMFFHSDGKGKNVFTTNHKKGNVWDWSLPNIYENEGE